MRGTRISMHTDINLSYSNLIDIIKEFSGSPTIRRSKTSTKTKDTTYFLLDICKNLIQFITDNQSQIPFAIRAMMRIVQNRARKATAKSTQSVDER